MSWSSSLLRIAVMPGILAGIVLLATGSRPSAQSPAGRERINGREVAAGRVIVKLRDGTTMAALGSLERRAEAVERRVLSNTGAVLVRSGRLRVDQLIALFSSALEVQYVEPDYLLYDSKVSSDPHFNQQWGLLNPYVPGADIHATAAWDLATGASNIVIGISDTAIDTIHPDLQRNMWSAPRSFTVTLGGQTLTCPAGTHGVRTHTPVPRCDSPGEPGELHGTHVAGIAGASGQNGMGTAGVNWNASLMTLAFMQNGFGYLSDAITSMEFAIQVKSVFAGTSAGELRVVNASWGGAPESESLREQIDRLGAYDVLFVAAAMNDGRDLDQGPTYPASYSNANQITVAASTSDDALAWFSNYGRNSVHLVAPGQQIQSTTPGGWAMLSGTSMAAPFVTGAAALILSRCPMSTADLKRLLLDTVDRRVQFESTTISGGRLNVARALQSCITAAPPAPPAVRLTAPLEGTSFFAPASILLEALPSDTDGSISAVEFYAGTALVGSVTSAPYRVQWANVPAGSYALRAVAIDNSGLRTDSDTAIVTVSASSGWPAPWISADVGEPGQPGSASFNAGAVTVRGAGAEFGGSADAFHFVHHLVRGDTEFIARLVSMEDRHTLARAGIMIAASLEQNKPFAALTVRPTGHIEFLTREGEVGGTEITQIDPGPQSTFPAWLKLRRTRSSISAFVSRDGSAWTFIANRSVAAPTDVLVGLISHSHDISILNTATFDAVSATTTPPLRAPDAPRLPNPPDGATQVPVEVLLKWTAPGATHYSVRLGTTNPPPQTHVTDLANPYISITGGLTLASGTRYFWQIEARNAAGRTPGPVWSFTTAASTTPTDIVVYASDVAASALHGTWATAGDASSPSGIKLQTPDRGVAYIDRPLASPTDYVDVTFAAPANTPYTVWLRMKALNDNKFNDAVWLQFSDARDAGLPIYAVGSTSGLLVNLATDSGATSLRGWGWRNSAYWLSQPTTVTFASAGVHTVRIQIREDGVQWDQLVLSPSTYLTAPPGLVTSDGTIVPKPLQLPAVPIMPSPTHGATGVPSSTTLGWSAPGATRYDVRLGTTNPPPTVAMILTAPAYTPSLTAAATYFWQVIAHNDAGTTSGPVWSFTTAASTSPTNIVVYASDVAASALHGTWATGGDASSPNGIKLQTPDSGVAHLDRPLASPADYIDLTFAAPANTPYTVWLRMKALNDNKFNDAVWLQFSDARSTGFPVYAIGSTSGLLVNLATDAGATSLRGWGWRNSAYWLNQATKITFATAGVHTVRIQIREDGVQWDQLVLSPSTYLTAPPGPVTSDGTIVSKP
jgi:subtilisin family serine protease